MVGTRDRIIVATNELFRRHGYNGTTLAQISEASAATIGSIYHFFPGGKEALAVAVVDSTGEVYRELFESIVAEAVGPSAAYVDFFAGAAAVLEESDFIDPCPIGTIAREVANTSEPLRQAAERAFNSWISAVHHHLTSAGVPHVVAEELASLFVATVEGTFVLSRTQRSTTPLIAAGRHLGALVDHAITSRRQAARPHRPRRAGDAAPATGTYRSRR
jgi:AcrR family transcriptional regulator